MVENRSLSSITSFQTSVRPSIDVHKDRLAKICPHIEQLLIYLWRISVGIKVSKLNLKSAKTIKKYDSIKHVLHCHAWLAWQANGSAALILIDSPDDP